MKKSDIGIYGLGVMGQNLALNFNDNEFRVSAFNRKLPGEDNLVKEFMNGPASKTAIQGFEEVEDFVQSIKPPRKILIMVKAGAPVDSVIDQLRPLLDEGDILIDGGNSHHADTNRRSDMLENQNIYYVGTGVSGGEEGARNGPSLMPGGSEKAWPEIKPLFESIAATSPDGDACCSWMGSAGAGHFVKMVHNGIEYAIMQMIAECYEIMRLGMQMDNADIAQTFSSWNSDLLSSYLLEITADIFRVKDPEDDRTYIIDHILDKAGQKGTGRWTALTALELGVPLPMITEAVFARTMSSFKDLRIKASEEFEVNTIPLLKKESLDQLREALLGGQLIAFSEGFWLLRAAKQEYGWEIPFAEVADTWSGGCIIRSALLKPIAASFREKPELQHLLLAPLLKEMTNSVHENWRLIAAHAVESGLAVPVTAAALAHFDSLRSERLPANLIQAQRDYFGAHQYERTDQPRGKFFHTKWKERLQ
ncbi:decarboxylating NADP(+)-dependent phosphogluconate dehydrogenase [Aliifodinibius salicampi]|uniref:6-phosphogluconate dehydrogenase, decarboxylating n=1 Tax=Fodinibius salicampi TaxID=1920655 RepID=A0ABT3Q123_9BACT|nr:decarboxylating NADP(+)-dependent phosphogluconate dehydrogenase [Fodinibius salicampi]MCW9713813.1 decarboxylating NADP(+)-dependent phosphogluconate dehydrogenase [Fodinibius salicampi]